MTECFMFSGTRAESRDKFNQWAKDKPLNNMVIHEQIYRNRDSISETGLLICVYYDEKRAFHGKEEKK